MRGSRASGRVRTAGIAGVLALGLVGALGACGSNDSPGTSDASDAVAVTAVSADPQSLNPGLTTDFVTQDISAKIFEGLVWLDAKNRPQPQLAKSWTISPDHRTYTFTLQTGVTWHDGKPFTAEDVKWSFEEGLADNSRAQGVLANIASIETPNDHEVVITLEQPYAPFLNQMKVFDTPVLPKHVFDGTDEATNPASNKPIGTGPFRFVDWQRGTSVTLERNPDYWDHTRQPKLDQIIFQVVPDAQTRTAGLEKGDYDFLASYYLPTSDIPRLEKDDNLAVRKSTSIPALDFLAMNSANPALAKVPVRQAIAQAIDRERIVSQGMDGLGIPGTGSFGSGFDWLDSDVPGYDELYPHDPAAAKQKLTAAGVSKLTLRLAYDSARPTFAADAQIIRDNLAAIGIDVRLDPTESTVFKDKVYGERDFDLALASFTSSGDPAIGYHRIYQTNTERAPNLNPTGYSNPKVDSLLEQAARTMGTPARATLYAQAEAILNKDVPTLILADEQEANAASVKLTGTYTGVNALDQWQTVSREN